MGRRRGSARAPRPPRARAAADARASELARGSLPRRRAPRAAGAPARARRRARAGSLPGDSARRMPREHPARLRRDRLRKPVSSVALPRGELQPDGVEGRLHRRRRDSHPRPRGAADAGARTHGRGLRRRASRRRASGPTRPRTAGERHEALRSAHPHDLAHHRRLRGDGGRRASPRSSSRRSGSASRAPTSARSRTTSRRSSAGSGSARASSASATSARWR